MEKKFVVYQGVKMPEDWPARIRAAQNEVTIGVNGTEYDRVKFGEEKDDADTERDSCPECSVLRGQFHVSGCDAEQCPACEGQFITCDCICDD